MRAIAANRIAVFTAIDDTLIDARTFEAGNNRQIVRQLEMADVPVIPVTGMTLEEVEPIARNLGFQRAMIIEAGGAIARWRDTEWAVESCGPDADSLLDFIREIEDRSGASLLVYSVAPDAEAARLSGRTGEMLRHSTHRRFSEPFVIESGTIEEVQRAAASIGLRVRRGRRFFYLSRASDEGEAFRRTRKELRCDITIAFGGSPVDLEFLSRAEIPIIVPSQNGEPDPELLASIPHARVAPAPAPEGWAAAMIDVCGALHAQRIS